MLQPELKLWGKSAAYLFDAASAYHLFVIIFYTGVVKLPCKSDYWCTNNPWPQHPIMTKFSMTQDCFAFL
eukprot:8841758-Ditylum_brightwellii.AAC.1